MRVIHTLPWRFPTSSFIQYLVAVLQADYVYIQEMLAFAVHNIMPGYWTDTKHQG